jgi:hypothetical protein
MLRNVIIILASIAVVAWNIYVFRNRKKFSFTKKNYAVGLLVLWLLTTFILNAPVILSPMSPSIRGTVISEETKQPIANCNIKAYWQVMTAGPGGGDTRDTYHQIITKTDGKGEFQLPRYPKVLGLYGFLPIIMTQYDGIRIVAYIHGYGYSQEDVDRLQSSPFEATINMYKNICVFRPKPTGIPI